MKLKYFVACIDGIDRSGKDTIAAHLSTMFRQAGFKYIVRVRGTMSMNVYSKLFHRDRDYDYEANRYTLNVLTECDYDDWIVRCNATNEPTIDFEKHTNAFDEEYKKLVHLGYPVLRFNTSRVPVHAICMTIMAKLDTLNEGVN